jgi:ATP/maltotriose-dependent transcriptional regulator MalT
MRRVILLLGAGCLIQRKITVPELPDRLVSRPRIEHVPGALIERRQVVLVLATAGAGKTTADRGIVVRWTMRYSRGLAP